MRLRVRLAEIAKATFARIGERAPIQPEALESEYVLGLRGAVTAALDWAITGIESDLDPQRDIPDVLIDQACRAAWAGVSAETIHRRYLIGAETLSEFLRKEVPEIPIGRLDELLRKHEEQLEHLVSAVACAHARELRLIESSPDEMQAQKVRRLLAGEFVDLNEFDYNFARLNLAIITIGRGAVEALQRIAQELHCELLRARVGERSLWAWLGRARQPKALVVERVLNGQARNDLRFAIGEWQPDLNGWRDSHLQAQAALRVALLTRAPITRYGQSLLLATLMSDEIALRSLRELYVDPLVDRNRNGRELRETLHQYLVCDRNVASAASILGIHRHTVRRRVEAAERRIERPIRQCHTDLALALDLDRLGIFADGLALQTGMEHMRRGALTKENTMKGPYGAH